MKAQTCQEAISYFEKSVQSGRNDLGENFFKENEGHFWGLIESRPFMRAKAYLADALLGCGRIEERNFHLFTDLRWLNQKPDWKGINGIGVVESRVERSSKISCERRFYITSLDCIEKFSKGVREHWGINLCF